VLSIVRRMVILIKQGAWIRVSDGAFWLIDEHADWVKREANAAEIGLSPVVWKSIATIPNDYGGENRKQILLTVMAAGFVRMRGHGDVVVFEFTSSTPDVLRACRAVLAAIAGPLTSCRFQNLASREVLVVNYADFERDVGEDLSNLLERAEPFAPEPGDSRRSDLTDQEIA
jgi:hypothetical protein